MSRDKPEVSIENGPRAEGPDTQVKDDIRLQERGTARIGGLGIVWPFSLLEVFPDELTISGFAFGKYSFKPSEVVSLQSLLWGGIKINHTRSDYPVTIIFIADFRFAVHRFRLSKDLLREIEIVGFFPSGRPEDQISGRGVPFRWWAILSVVGIWAGPASPKWVRIRLLGFPSSSPVSSRMWRNVGKGWSWLLAATIPSPIV